MFVAASYNNAAGESALIATQLGRLVDLLSSVVASGSAVTGGTGTEGRYPAVAAATMAAAAAMGANGRSENAPPAIEEGRQQEYVKGSKAGADEERAFKGQQALKKPEEKEAEEKSEVGEAVAEESITTRLARAFEEESVGELKALHQGPS